MVYLFFNNITLNLQMEQKYGIQSVSSINSEMLDFNFVGKLGI